MNGMYLTAKMWDEWFSEYKFQHRNIYDKHAIVSFFYICVTMFTLNGGSYAGLEYFDLKCVWRHLIKRVWWTVVLSITPRFQNFLVVIISTAVYWGMHTGHLIDGKWWRAMLMVIIMIIMVMLMLLMLLILILWFDWQKCKKNIHCSSRETDQASIVMLSLINIREMSIVYYG